MNYLNIDLRFLFESSLLMGVLYTFYHLVLRSDTNFTLNRFYILSSLFISMLFPTISELLPSTDNTMVLDTIIINVGEITNTINSGLEEAGRSFPWLITIYLTGVVFMTIRLFYRLIKLTMFIRKGKVIIVNRHYLIATEGQYPTSSFFKYILWDNTVSYTDDDLDKILKHELTHVQQLHTLDNLVIELIQIFLWFNPFVYLFNNRMKEVHEYLADASVLNKSENYTPEDYEVLINKQVLNNIGYQLSNNFNMSNLKNRIMMTNKPRSSKATILKSILALPIAFVMMLNFSYSKQIQSDNTIIPASFKGGTEGLVEYMKKNTIYPEAARKAKAEGIAYISFNVEANGKVSDVKIAKSSGNRDLDNEAVRMVSTMPEWEPGTKDNKKVATTMTLPIKFVDKPSIKLNGSYSGKNIYITNPYKADGNGFAVDKVIVNGKNYDFKAPASAMEIDLGSYNVGDKIEIEILYFKGGSLPKVINPEVLK